MSRWSVAMVVATIFLGFQLWTVTSSVALADLAVRQALGLREGAEDTRVSEWSEAVREHWGSLTIGGWLGIGVAMGVLYVVERRGEGVGRWGVLALVFSLMSSLLVTLAILGWVCAVSNVVCSTIPIHSLP